jgi:trans-aconitate methyltransferase
VVTLFDYQSCWLKEGDVMKGRWKPSEITKIQEDAIITVLKDSGIRIRSVMELGIGFGRITGHVIKHINPKKYVGLDISKSQIKFVNEDYPTVKTVHTDINDYTPKEKFDVVVSCEFLMHVVPEKIDEVCDKMAAMSDFIVNLDYSPVPEKRRSLSPHNWEYNYAEKYQKLGYTVATVRISPLQAITVAKKN